jgi:cyclopropane fatty-acyl-phospholipid synthase-like methyltransferase
MANGHQAIYESIIMEGFEKGNVSYIFEIYSDGKKKYNTEELFNGIDILEKKALDSLKIKSRILDIGAGAGRISYCLQNKGFISTALEKSNIICEILKKRGIRRIINSDIYKYVPKNKCYDSILCIKNYSILGRKKNNISKLFRFLKKNLLKCGDELIFISNEAKSKRTEIVKRRFIFKDKIGPWFETLYPSLGDIMKIAEEEGLSADRAEKDETGQFFLSLKK